MLQVLIMFTIIFRLRAAHEFDLSDDRKILTQQIYTNNNFPNSYYTSPERCTCTCVCDLERICTPSITPTLSPSLETKLSPTALPSTQTFPLTVSPTFFPSTSLSVQPTISSRDPTFSPTLDPTLQPTRLPSPFPTLFPTISRNNTGGPTRFPRGGSFKPLAVFVDVLRQPTNLPYLLPGQLPYSVNETGYSPNINGSSL